MARTKEFDEDAVLLKAMKLFWEQGYEKTSMQDLVTGMGVHKRSMYDTFGDKRTLYIKALKRYQDMMKHTIDRIVGGSLSAGETIRRLMEMTVREDEEIPKGCLIVNTAVELAMHDAEVRTMVDESQNGVQELIRGIIEAGQQSGELDKSLDAEALSHYFNNAWTGLRVLAKTTDDREKLMGIVDTTLSVLQSG